MKRKWIATTLTCTMLAAMVTGCGGAAGRDTSSADAPSGTEAGTAADGGLEGEITFWHSFTQGARMDAVQAAADSFMEIHPGVRINIETYSWGGFQHEMECGDYHRRSAGYEHGSEYR